MPAEMIGSPRSALLPSDGGLACNWLRPPLPVVGVERRLIDTGQQPERPYQGSNSRISTTALGGGAVAIPCSCGKCVLPLGHYTLMYLLRTAVDLANPLEKFEYGEPS